MEIDYDLPILLDVVFKEAIIDEETQKEIPGEEIKASLGIIWNDICSIQTYPFEARGHWEKYPGPKFYITLSEQGTHLCLGNFKDMFAYWKQFRKTYYGRQDP